MAGQLICVHHRLAGLSGHRFHEALAFVEEARRRGLDLLLLIHAEAGAEVRAALPGARAVLHDPVFRRDLSFDERTRAFADLLHQHVDPDLRAGARLLVTVATQCEARALLWWLAELPVRKRPWALALFPSDRWNRSAAAVGAFDGALAGPEARAEQLLHLRTLADDLAAQNPDVRRRLLVCTHAPALCAELRERLGVPVEEAPMLGFADGFAALAEARTDAGAVPRVAVVGGARPEKGSHLLPAIVAAARPRIAVEFLIHLVNEQLPAAAFAALEKLDGLPGIEVVRGPLDRAGYLGLFAAADLLLLPYERSAYRQRSSGIVSEAALSALPIVVPSGTWPADQVANGRVAGVVYEGDSPTDIATGLVAALRSLPALTDQARELAAAWRRTQTLPAFLDWLELRIARRAPALSRPWHRRLADRLASLRRPPRF